MMHSRISVSRWLRSLPLALALAWLPAHAADNTAATASAGPQTSSAVAMPETIVSDTPMKFDAEGKTVRGQLVVAQEVIDEPGSALVYTLLVEPANGRVGLSGGDEEDVFKNKTAHSGYFAYQPAEDFVGDDSFTYSVRNVDSGLVFQNKVLIAVKAPKAFEFEKFVITEKRERPMAEHPVAVTTRPNTAFTQKVPSHEDFMKAEDRASIANAKVAYSLDDETKPQHGSAKLDRATGQLTYAPDPGFIGEDRFNYYTYDENNAQYGVENVVVVSVEPIRDFKKIVADRTKSRQVDLVFVINNSPSMAPHQARIAENLRRFRSLFDERHLDYRIGVLTTDFVNKQAGRGSEDYYKTVRGTELDKAGNPVLDRKQQPKTVKKKVASNGTLVTLPVLPQPWVTPTTPDSVFAELVKVGTNGDSNRTAFTSVYNFVANYQHGEHQLLRPDATTIVVFFMDEEETRMAVWKESAKDAKNNEREAEWLENGKLPDLLSDFNKRNPGKRQTLDSYINYWVIRPFVIVKGNQRGKIEMEAVVAPDNVSHRRAAELTGGTVLNIQSDFSAPLAALGDRIADTVAVALDTVPTGSTLYKRSIKVLVDGKEVPSDSTNGWIYDDRSNSIRFQGTSKQQAFAARIEVTYEEHR